MASPARDMEDTSSDEDDGMVLVSLFASPGHCETLYEWEWIEPKKLAWLTRTNPIVPLGGEYDGLNLRFLGLLDRVVTDVQHQRVLKRYLRINGHALGEIQWTEPEAEVGDATEAVQ